MGDVDETPDGDVRRRTVLALGVGAAAAVALATWAEAIPDAAADGWSLTSPASRKAGTTLARHVRHRALPAPAASTPSTPPVPAPSAGPHWTSPVSTVAEVLPGAPANAIALTIDDGPHPVYTPMVLEVLQRYRVKATFSMIGINVQQYPQVARQVVAAGHTICNHSMRHPIPFTALTPAQIDAEVADAMNRIWDATRTVPKLFRAPGGGWSAAVYRSLSPYNLIPLDWDVDPRDWTVPGVAHIEEVLDSGRAGDILLCHDGGGNRSETVQALSQVIPALLARKLEFVTL